MALGVGWALDERRSSAVEKLPPLEHLLPGIRVGRAVVRIVAVDDEGQVHFSIPPGLAEKNRPRARRLRPDQRPSPATSAARSASRRRRTPVPSGNTHV